MIEILPRTLLAQAVNFGILMFFLNKFLFKKVSVFLDKRAETIKGSLDEIDKERNEITRLREEYQERMTQLDKENYKRMQEAIQKGQEAAAQIVTAGEEKANQVIAEAKQVIVREKQDALKEIREEVGTLAVDIASKVVKQNYDVKTQKKLIDSFIEKLGGSQ